MAFDVMRTSQVKHIVERVMDRTEVEAYLAVRDDLHGRGCLAGATKMQGSAGADYPLCSRHVAYDWRVYTAYAPDGRIVIVALDRHTPTNNPADAPSELLPGLATVGRRSKDKPPCCDDPQEPPEMNAELCELLDALLE